MFIRENIARSVLKSSALFLMIFMLVEVPVFAEEHIQETQETIEECYIQTSSVKRQTVPNDPDSVELETFRFPLKQVVMVVSSTTIPTLKFYILYQSLKLYD